MSKKYNCKKCNFHTGNHYNFNMHKKTQKHITLHAFFRQSKNDCKISKNNICEYCQKSISHKNNIKRHYNACKKYKVYQIEQEKNKVIEQLTAELKNKNDKIVSLNKKLNKLKNIKTTIQSKDETIYNLVNKLNNITGKYNEVTNKNTKKRIKKQRIPATVRNTIWKLHIGNKTESKCSCCSVEPITKGNFECGHILSEKDGGKIKLDNLRPICGLCNKSMGTKNMLEFMRQYGYAIKNVKQSYLIEK